LMRKTYLFLSVVAIGTAGLSVAAWRGSAQGANPPPLGAPLPGLTPAQVADFKSGAAQFGKVETRADGLGVVFNGVSCGQCHAAGALGGAGTNLTIARVSRIGGIRNGGYSDLPDLGGPVIQARSLREFFPDCPVPGEVVPAQANYVSHRITTPLFGAGLIEAIPDAAILARAGRTDADGVCGAANRLLNPETGLLEVGRFGWKAQHGTLHLFAGDAYLNEMGVSNPSFPVENQPQGKPIPPGWAATGIEDDGGDVTAFTNFMRYLAPAARRPLPPDSAARSQIANGERLFDAIRCTACHVPSMQTGPNAIAALSNKPVPLFSDLLLHRMGPGLADGIQQGLAKGDQFRTAPLWGLSTRRFFLHDGRTSSPDAAVMAHDGEAAAARQRYSRLSPADRQAVQAFLGTL
ncbi:MAG TPA: di-heme oxidoredictase family protein, partial [Chthonomonadaceae bacterium]|nr:di-heme oxidoredictase family protein [Chthonomonadaceae bacterium]